MATGNGDDRGPGATGAFANKVLGDRAPPPRSVAPALGARVESCRSGGGRRGGSRDVCREVFKRLVAGGYLEAGPEQRALLEAHFARLPPSYQLYVNVEKAEDVLIHHKVFAEAKDSDRRPAFAFHVHYLMLEQNNVDTPTNSDVLEEEDDAGIALPTRSGIPDKHIHEILFCSIHKRGLLGQLSALLFDIELNVRDVHVFSTKDGYSLYVFVVDGWPTQDTNGLREALEAAPFLKKGPWSSVGMPIRPKNRVKKLNDLKNKRRLHKLNEAYVKRDTNGFHKALEAAILRNKGPWSRGGMRIRPKIRVKKLKDLKNKRRLHKLNEEYHQNVMAHFHSILATEVSFLIPMMTAIFAMETTLTVETKVRLIFVFLAFGAVSLFGLIISSGTVARMWQPVASGIALFVTIFSLGLFQFAMGLFFPQFAKRTTDTMETESLQENMEDDSYIWENILLFLTSALAIVFIWICLFHNRREHQAT